ncbi:MAG: trypsin-like peptidase domain-containing protein [Phycisphaerae bacterium]|jgi:S1-C subfamily serine protease
MSKQPIATGPRRPAGLIRAALSAILFLSASPALAADAPGYDAEKFMAEKAPALVTIRFHLRSGAGEDDEASESEITGVVIDPKGLVLCSNIQLTGLAMAMSMMGRGAAPVPTNIRVLAGDDTQGVKAKLLARDKELDLAWIQLNDPPAKPLAFVDLARSARPRIGQKVVSVRRMGKYFDRVPAIREAQIGAITRKPRDFYVLGGSINADFGLPVFTTAGDVLGITILPISEENEDELSGNPLTMLGGISGILDLFGGVILPAEEVVKATKRAREHPDTRPASEEADEPTKQGTPERKDADKDAGK